LKRVFHPRAFLSHRRNVSLGLAARTRILQVLEKQSSDTKAIVSTSGLSYNVVFHHLRLLEAEGVVVRKGDKRPFVWNLTGVGQQRLEPALNKE
jgi:predicted transcriptional regulator